MQEDLEVTGVSRSGRVRKKSSKLMDFESPDDIETRYRRQTPVKHSPVVKQEEPQEYPEPRMDVAGAASGSDSDYYENAADGAESLETDSSESEEGSTRTPANSLYMMEKSSKKKLIVKDGRVVGRVKAQRKDKGKTRITAYMLWAKEARNELLRKHPEMDFSAISKRLGELWANVNYNERYLWKRKAKRIMMQREHGNQSASKIISNLSVRPTSHAGPGRPPANRPKQPQAVSTPQQALVPVSPSTVSITLSVSGPSSQQALYRVTGCGAVELAAHLRLLGESLAIIGERLKEHEGQIAVSGSVSVLLDTLLCALAPLLGVTRAVPAFALPAALLTDTMHNIAYVMPGL